MGGGAFAHGEPDLGFLPVRSIGGHVGDAESCGRTVTRLRRGTTRAENREAEAHSGGYMAGAAAATPTPTEGKMPGLGASGLAIGVDRRPRRGARNRQPRRRNWLVVIDFDDQEVRCIGGEGGFVAGFCDSARLLEQATKATSARAITYFLMGDYDAEELAD